MKLQSHGKAIKIIFAFLCLTLIITVPGYANALTASEIFGGPVTQTENYNYNYNYGQQGTPGYPGYGYGGTPQTNQGWTGDKPGTVTISVGEQATQSYMPRTPWAYPAATPAPGYAIPRYTITYMPGTWVVSSASFATEWYPGDAIVSAQGFARAGYTQTGWSYYDGGPKVFSLGQHISISNNIILYPYWEPISTARYLTVYYTGPGSIKLSGTNVPNGWSGKLEPGQSFTFFFYPAESNYVYSLLFAGRYRELRSGNQYMVTYEMLQGENQTMNVRFDSIYMQPKMGDESNIGMWAVIFLLSAAAVCTTAYKIKKERA